MIYEELPDAFPEPPDTLFPNGPEWGYGLGIISFLDESDGKLKHGGNWSVWLGKLICCELREITGKHLARVTGTMDKTHSSREEALVWIRAMARKRFEELRADMEESILTQEDYEAMANEEYDDE